MQQLERVAVLGPTASDDLFGVGVNSIDKTILIDNLQFTVVGITVAKGGSGFTNPDSMVYIPLTTAQQEITGSIYVNDISIEAVSSQNLQTVQDEVTTLLLKRHDISDPTKADFSILNRASLSSTLSSITNILTILLASIASISLIVGGIGIMNMMLTTVTEKTKEIGLRKAIGAKKGDISSAISYRSRCPHGNGRHCGRHAWIWRRVCGYPDRTSYRDGHAVFSASLRSAFMRR